MSLTDPQSNWWNRDATRSKAAYVCWVAAILLALVSMWSIMAENASPLPPWFEILAICLPIPLIIGGSFLIAFGTADREGHDRFSARMIVWPMAGYFIAMGIGAGAGAIMSPRGFDAGHVVYAVFIAGGIIAIVVAELLIRRTRRNGALQQRVERTGVTTSGVVTRARSYSVNYHPVTKITVKFVDAEGRERWASDSIGGSAKVGDRMEVRYSPQDLGRRAAVILSRPGHGRRR